MLLVTKDTNKQYSITLRWWNGKYWTEDVAGELLAGAEPKTEQELQWLKDDIATFNAGKDLGWLIHCPVCQECLLEIQEVQADD